MSTIHIKGQEKLHQSKKLNVSKPITLHCKSDNMENIYIG